MNVNAPTLKSDVTEDPSLQQLAEESIEQWSTACQRFLDRQRHEIFEVAPPAQKLKEHRAALKLMLRVGRALYLAASDPDSPDRRSARELHGRLLQLEHSWRMLQEPLPDAEADTLIKQVFPG
jgi:hypothetical protein